MVKICELCSVSITSKYGTRFCSKSCSVSFNNSKRTRTEETKRKISKSVKKYVKENREEVEARHELMRVHPHTKIKRASCNCCNKEFWSYNSKICCSPECARENSTYRKIVHEYHNNGKIIKLESSWEVEIAEFLDSKNISWNRPKHIPWIDSKGKKRRYFPDFYLPDLDLYLDPKNDYQIHIGKEKLNAIQIKCNLHYGSVEYLKEVISSLS